MLKEELQNPYAKYLLATLRFSDNAIRLWKEEMTERLKGKKKDTAYYSYLNWERAENEMAIFTTYAYADFPIPRQFDCIFDDNNPETNIRIKFTLTQSIYEGWYPIDCIEHGHKHLCIFTFEDKIPDIFNSLYLLKKKYLQGTLGYFQLGLCKYEDLEAIKNRKNYVAKLKKLHGKNWYEFDNYEER